MIDFALAGLHARAGNTGEMSQNAGGLIRWPVWLLLPVGFAILLLQAVSELIKRIAFLTGHRSEPFSDADGKSTKSCWPRSWPAEAERLRTQLEAQTAPLQPSPERTR